VIALAGDQLEAAVQVFYVRGGRVRGQRGWVVDKVEDVGDGELVEHFLSQVYGEDSVAGNGQAPARLAGTGGPGPGARPAAGAPAVPGEVLVPVLPPGAGAVEEWLAARRGSRVQLRVPRRGDKKALLDTVARNAAESLALHKTKRASDLTTRSLALNEITDALGLEVAPLRIECYDVSNLQGTHVVASMVVFGAGLPRKSETGGSSVRGPGAGGAAAPVPQALPPRSGRSPAAAAGTWGTGGKRPRPPGWGTPRPAGRGPSPASVSSPTSPTWW